MYEILEPNIRGGGKYDENGNKVGFWVDMNE